MEKTCASCRFCGMPLEKTVEHAGDELQKEFCSHYTDENGQLKP